MKRTALITGASSGIGSDLARLFAKDAWNVVLVARTEAKLRELAASLERERGISATVIPADLEQVDAAQRITGELRARGIELDALVNNAGFGVAGPFLETDLPSVLGMIQVNVVALTELTRRLLPDMVARRRGYVLNVASTAAFQPGPLMAVYYATKAYVLSFSEALAEELRGSGVTVTTVCPGPTETGFAAAAHMESSRLFRVMRPMASSDVARAAYDAMLRGRSLVIPGFWNKLLAQSIRLTPRRVVTMITRRLQEPA
jgi:short-subunit dehydrogenase